MTISILLVYNIFIAAVVKSADTRDLKSLGSNTVPVQVRSAAPISLKARKIGFERFFCCLESARFYSFAPLYFNPNGTKTTQRRFVTKQHDTEFYITPRAFSIVSADIIFEE